MDDFAPPSFQLARGAGIARLPRLGQGWDRATCWRPWNASSLNLLLDLGVLGLEHRAADARGLQRAVRVLP